MKKDESNTIWTPYREPLRATLLRTGLIAVIGGLVMALASPAGLRRWPLATLLFYWPALGGHFVELAFLNWIRPRLPGRRAVHVAGRVAVWLAGGVVLIGGMWVTSRLLIPDHPPRWMRLPVERIALLGAVGFVGVELVAHLAMRMRGVQNFYDGRG